MNTITEVELLKAIEKNPEPFIILNILELCKCGIVGNEKQKMD